MTLKKILFVDRDGTLVREPEDEQVDSVEKIALLAGVVPAMLRLKEAGYRFVMVSNQDGLGTPHYPFMAFERVQAFILRLFASQGITFDDILVCPHTPEQQCPCRKPRLGLMGTYLTDQQWDRSRSFVVGDRDTDISLATGLGIQGFKVSESTEIGAMSWQNIASAILDKPRKASVTRKTKETAITIDLNLDNGGNVTIATGIGFFDHMVEQIARHSGVGMVLTATGDLKVDEHHTVEDTAIVLGEALRQALGDKARTARYGFVLPMDEALAQIALDLSGRAYFQFEGTFERERVGELPTEMISHFFSTLATVMGASLHMSVKGSNCHHKAEALFKGFGRALAGAIRLDQTQTAIPSTKGVL